MRALLTAADWQGREGAELRELARMQLIVDEAQRVRLRHAVSLLIGSVLENPVRQGEFEQLQNLENVVNVASLRFELATDIDDCPSGA